MLVTVEIKILLSPFQSKQLQTSGYTCGVLMLLGNIEYWLEMGRLLL